MMNKSIFIIILSIFFLVACGGEKKKDKSQSKMIKEEQFEEGSFGYDLTFLEEKDENLVILRAGQSRVVVSAKYQAKVFTSSSGGNKGRSYGWINYEAFEGDENEHMNAYGGENRFWLGPEGSKFSLFFEPETEMIYDNWRTPAPVDTESWEIEHKDTTQVKMTKTISLRNYVGTQLNMKVEREISVLTKDEIENSLKIQVENLESVGFTTNNSITNTGENTWNKETGAPCIWILDMFTPSDETVIVIPYKDDVEGRVATTDYFGEIPEDRINYKDAELFFKADGKSRGKLGIAPERAKSVAGSYDAKNKLLTITTFEVDNKAIYLNQEWTPEKDPLKGDAVNAYNDGPLEDGSQMGPFYEIESVSPAAFLAPSEKLNHNHNVFHFTGNEEDLNKISQKVLGLSLQRISGAF